MFTNRISKILVVLLVLAAALATVSFATHHATTSSADRSYDSIEQVRVASVQADRSYDSIEQIRTVESMEKALREYQLGERYGELPEGLASEKVAREYWLGERYGQTPNADHSYEMIEALRLGR